jgi:hypothetical protein
VGRSDAGPGGVVGEDCGHVEIKQSAAQVYDRKAATAKGAGDAAILDTSNDAVAAPVFEPGWCGIVEVMTLQVDGLGTMKTDVVGDAAQEAAAVAARRFDQECYTRILADHERSVTAVTPKNHKKSTKNFNDNLDKLGRLQIIKVKDNAPGRGTTLLRFPEQGRCVIWRAR